ncbi:MAG: hypothetical protein DRR15_18220 [Gammaproteobacteria bacterium]|nr:MAG: hypothetical protein DRR15_18220 [Gammaproteobacteria bacterium]
MPKSTASVRTLLLGALFAFLSVSAATAASFQKTDGSVVDPIPFRQGDGDHPYNLTTGADLAPGVSLRFVDLHFADLFLADLSSANLTGANLVEASLNGADLTGADLTNANLTDGVVFGAHLPFATLSNANLTRNEAANADFSDADLTNANLTDADMSRVNLVNALLDSAVLTGAILTSADFSDADLTDAINLSTTTFVPSLGAPSYNANTDFTGTGFNPVAAGWILVPEPAAATLQLSALLGVLGVVWLRRRAGSNS